MVMFNTRMRPEVIQPFWAALQVGTFIRVAAEGVATYRVKGRRWILAESGIRPRRGRHLKGRCLTFSEREESRWVAPGGESVWQRASRPKPAKLWVNQQLREIVERLLLRRYSPEQIAGRLRVQFPADPEM